MKESREKVGRGREGGGRKRELDVDDQQGSSVEKEWTVNSCGREHGRGMAWCLLSSRCWLSIGRESVRGCF